MPGVVSPRSRPISERSNATVPPEDYALVKDFFDQMIAAEQAPVVLMKQ